MGKEGRRVRTPPYLRVCQVCGAPLRLASHATELKVASRLSATSNNGKHQHQQRQKQVGQYIGTSTYQNIMLTLAVIVLSIFTSFCYSLPHDVCLNAARQRFLLKPPLAVAVEETSGPDHGNSKAGRRERV